MRVNNLLLRAVTILSIVSFADALIAEEVKGDDQNVDSKLGSLRFKPQFDYRLMGFDVNKRSVFHKAEHQDYAQQYYLSGKIVSSIDLKNEFVVEPSLSSRRSRYDEDNLVVKYDQAYLRSSLRNGIVVIAGKKSEYNGSGVLVNPSDLLNSQKSVFDDFSTRQGKTLVRVSKKLGEFDLGLSLIPRPGTSIRRGSALFRVNTTIGDADTVLSALMNDATKSLVGISTSKIFADQIEFHGDARYQRKQFSPAEEALRAYSQFDPERQSTQYVLGSRYIFTSKSSFFGEFIANESGLSRSELSEMHSQIATFTDNDQRKEPSETLLGRSYYLIGTKSEDLLDDTSLEFMYVSNIDDRSQLVMAKAQYFLSAITSVELSPTLFAGASDSEWGEYPFKSAVYLTFKGAF